MEENGIGHYPKFATFTTTKALNYKCDCERGRQIMDQIFVCQSGTCRSKGSDAALVEIEELANLVGNCTVKSTGCIGYCNQGPAVEAWSRNLWGSKVRKVFTKVNSINKSADIIKFCTGIDPPLENLPPEIEVRLSVIHLSKQREYFASTYQWNKALACGLTEGAINDTKLRVDFERIFGFAGYRNIELQELLTPTRCLQMPTSIEAYVLWTLRNIEVVSRHSAIFSFETKDLKRGTPHPRGRSRMPDPVTWHTTLLGEVGSNKEGPLPWIERDYTPISTALEWERGRCDILIKVYSDGQLSSWLNRRSNSHEGNDQPKFWLSKPLRTLSVPSLVPDDGIEFRPASLLLLLAGTGIVALPQILAHREPFRLLGIATPKYKQLNCPIDLIQSCREDDVLLLPQIKEYCKEGLKQHPQNRGLRHYKLLLTEGERGEDVRPPFHGRFDATDAVQYDDALKDVANAIILKTRLNEDIVADAIGGMELPCRVIVSGPDTFNDAARRFLDACGVDSSHVTILAA
jgi:hypothetical protein